MDQVTWIDLLDPAPDEVVAAVEAVEGSVHASVIGRLLTPPRHDDDPRPRLESQGTHLFGVLVVPVVAATGDRVVNAEVDVLVSPRCLLTVRKTPPGCAAVAFDDVRAAALAAGETPGMCLYRLFDEVAERFLSLLDTFDDDVEELEDRVQEWESIRIRERISQIRHDMLHVRRVLTPTRDAARSVLDDRVELDGGVELFPREVEIHFADAYDKLLRATDGLDLARDLLAGVRDYHQAQVANDQNEVMKRLTVVASVLLLPTFIVGLYGQNLKGVPEFGLRYGYAWSWALIVVTTVAQLIWFRRKRWI
jgi:magnesium transporter